MSRRVGTFLLLAALGACDVPNFDGPQLQEPPQGFLLQPDPTTARSVFTELPVVYHDRWVQSQPPFSTITINGHAGTLTLEDVMAAQDARRAGEDDPDMVFGAIEPLSIDGREAWAWEEHVASPTRGVPWVAYRAMVPYDEVSYAIEIESEDPLLKAGAPASLQAIVTTFAVGKTVYNWPLIVIAVGLLLFALHTMRQRSRAKAARLRSINLVKVEKKEGPEEAEEEEDGAAPVGAGAPSAPGPPERPSAQ
jgi:hypothetical protein